MCITLVEYRTVPCAIVALAEPEKYSYYLCVVSKPQHFTLFPSPK